MATEAVTEQQITPSRESRPEPRPMEPLEIEDEQNDGSQQEVVYPSGPKLWSTMASLCIACFLSGLDLTIVAVTVPSLTDQFKTIQDIGWYSAAYGMAMSAFVFFIGQIYTLFRTKTIFLIGIVTFEIGSLICTFAPSSAVFIFGRAISGLGRGAINGGVFKLLRHCFPLSQQALMNSIVGGVQSMGLISAPLVGGVLIDAFSWRACFGVNLPLGVVCFVLTAYGAHDLPVSTVEGLTVTEKLKKINILGTVLLVPAVTCLLMVLQWGGSTYPWGSWQVIFLVVICAVLFVVLRYLQHRQGERALLPPKILKQRSILAGMWYSACCEGILSVTEYYMSIYFQGVRGYTPAKSGLLALPMIAGLTVAVLVSGVGTSVVGYYYPFMMATSVLSPIASGLLTTLDIEEQIGKAIGLLAFLGAAVGLGIQGPVIAMQAVLSIEDVSIGGAIINFGSGMGSSLWICASANLFQSRLVDEVQSFAPGTDVTTIKQAGLSDLRESIGPERLGNVLVGYENAVIQTLYIPLALALLTIVGSLAVERKSLKKRS
ncbi:aflatoxin efflux pump AFLT [Fusarium albosuccineum]|uniref:Aflatoxin efflux pump AFLT n=1 Tax=Fusarium albosuccineum TaxID=1237068 RepID=A0A8H4LKR5_9HYPO|nr:aflatoxin efflux pump AFLT [Fusarium albosuccineum]